MPKALTFSATPLEYVPANLRHDTNGWYIVYYEFNPFISMLVRKRCRLNALRRNCSTQLEFRIQVDSVIKSINAKLVQDLSILHSMQPQIAAIQASYQPKAYPSTTTPTMVAPATVSAPVQTPMPVSVGVSQMIPSTAQDEIALKSPDIRRSVATIKDVMQIYLKEKKKDTRSATFHSYNSFCNQFGKWLDENAPDCRMIHFKKTMAVEFLDSVEGRDGISNRTYNNLLKMARAFFSWAVAKCYAKENHFKGMSIKRVMHKKRTIIPADAQRLIDNYFKIHNPAMRIVMRMVYTSLLRPIEISRVQVHQIDFERHCIHMPGDKTKSWEPRDARMDSELEGLLRQHIIGADPDDYLFADRQWKCGKKSQGSHSYSKAWEDMRKGLLDAEGHKIIPDEFQLYSLKDTSINGMIKSGVDDLSAMQAAGHKDLTMTRIYADHFDADLINDLNASAPKFGQAVVKPSLKQTKKDSDNKPLS